MTVTEPTQHETAQDTGEPQADVVAAEDALVEDDVLVEEISIDGMCGVY